MHIALIGYGKMGKEIEKIALQRGHQISFKVDKDNSQQILHINASNTDVAIEFSQPETAFANISSLLKQGVSVVSGTTGWLEKKPQAEQIALEAQKAFFYASNYSLGVNLFFQLNEFLAKLMSKYPNYQVQMEEIHHTEKKDAPSGTAITLAEGIIEQNPLKTAWVNNLSGKENEITIVSKREPNVPGTHTITYHSPEDFIEIKHEAHNRTGFALGAVLAAEFIQNKQGIFSMKELLNF
ncbi:MAG: 4-hydroxy-tetrahydrodipicolinate reductase [Thermonemataceae bacterium]|nr:4-hydroxy-tetrahydrodipicolinate reductase [Thermonemataceae bacterium]